MKFDYYYGSQADQFNFIKIPKIILLDKTFASLSIQAKMLYGVLLDRMGLSMKNGWYDSENKVYIIYQIAEIQDDLGFTKKKAIDYLNELETFGLVEKRRRGLGLPSILYVKSFLQQKNYSVNKVEDDKSMFRGVGMGTSRVVDFDTSRGASFDTSRSIDLEPQEVSKCAPLINNTKENNTEESDYKSNHILSEDETGGIAKIDHRIPSTRDAYEEIIKENIEYDYLANAQWVNRDELDELVGLMVDTVSYDRTTMRIGGRDIPYAEVKSRFLKLTRSHIEYVLESLASNCTNIKDVYRYNLTTLFNAPVTMSNHYRAQVKHDMYGVSN